MIKHNKINYTPLQLLMILSKIETKDSHIKILKYTYFLNFKK